ncbi:MAG TPA: ABC transporter permease, partial [Flavobacterium sp.]|nr:ABC transporter permease [Flavobacterium sp.]
MNISFYIAKRYALSLSKSSAINIITAIASLGIIVSAMALFVVMSVFSGLKEFSLEFSNSTDPDLKAFPANGKFFELTEEQEKQIAQTTYFLSYSKVVEERVAFIYEEKELISTLKGVDETFVNVTNFKD